MNTREIILQKIQALSLGPMWTEKSYEESTLNSKSQASKQWLSNREDTRLNIEKNVLKVDIRPNKEVLDALMQTLKKIKKKTKWNKQLKWMNQNNNWI